MERVQDLEADRKDRELRSFALKIEVNPDYHPKIIGKRGAVITKIRKDHDVQINFPKKGWWNFMKKLFDSSHRFYMNEIITYLTILFYYQNLTLHLLM